MKDINLFRVEDSIYLKKIKSKVEVSKEDDYDGYLIESSEKEARRIIESVRSNIRGDGKRSTGNGDKKIGVIGGDDAFNRRAIETLKIDYLISVEGKTGRGNLKQRDSGLNHVVAKLAKEKGVVIIVDVSLIRKIGVEEKVALIERIIQKVKICRKAGCEIKIASLGTKDDEVVGEIERKAIGESLGMSSVQARDAVVF